MKYNGLLAAYYYPGWHHCPVRDASFPKHWSEWDLVYNCQSAFAQQELPNLPLWGREDESDPEIFAKKIATAKEYGVDAFIFAFYWSRGKRLLEGALNSGLLKAKNRSDIKFALMWANRMPRRVMPVKSEEARVIDPSRLVYTDPEDFVEFVEAVADQYFCQPGYLEVEGGKYLSIFDTAFFIKQLGLEKAQKAVSRAREKLAERFMKLHLVAIDPIEAHQPELKKIGFNAVSHYVFLPDWKGPEKQDFGEYAALRQQQWEAYEPVSALPYYPSVTPGWDANPRGVDYGKKKPGRYPWSPVIINRSPEAFKKFLEAALNYNMQKNAASLQITHIASWNEWSEGHYLEPDEKYGFAWLKAVKDARKIFMKAF
jgi:hypothetical protein